MSKKYEKLKTLLMELFQLDQPDLDFGIYRVLHAKAQEVTKFLDEDLLPQVKTAFERYKSSDRSELTKELAELRAGIERAGMNPDDSPKVKELEDKIANESVDVTKLESETYDHLYSFFRRYYSEGDFLSKRVYKPGVYAIPYEGEEVKLHWANADQYYIKTSEYLRDFAFRLNPFADEENGQDPMRVHFRLADVAEGEHGNVKESDANKRVFILASGDDWIAEDNAELVIRFEYRPATLTDWPDDERDGKKKPPIQKDLLEIAEKRILAVQDTGLLTWISELQKPHIKADGTESEKKKIRVNLERYTARNTFDYFIHKDLGGFLHRELDFYIKNEVMYLDDIDTTTDNRDKAENNLKALLSKIKVIRSIAHKIIDFLAQLENFQKKLWLKKKFVVQSDYCLTLDLLSESIIDEVVACVQADRSHGQLLEWRRLGFTDHVDLTSDEIKADKHLMVDTQFLDPLLKTRVIESLGELHSVIGGVLIGSENFQGLEFMRKSFRNKITSIYIDPPYNSSTSAILYKNDYRNSSWCSLIYERLDLGRSLLHPNHGFLCCTIDDVEQKLLSQIVERVFGELAGTVSIRSKPSGKPVPNGFAVSHEYAVFARTTPATPVSRLEHSDEQIIRYRETDDKGPFFWEMFRKAGSGSSREDRPTMYYPIYLDLATSSLRIPKMSYDESGQEYIIEEKTKQEEVAIYPVKDDGTEGRWYFGEKNARKLVSEFKAEKQSDGSYLVYRRRRPNEGVQPTTVWSDPKYSATEHGTALIKRLFGSAKVFSYPKSIYAVEDCLRLTGTKNQPEGFVLDFFAGSGTTGHAILNLNREDNGRRKYILIEMADYFDTVTKPRMQKVVYSKSWKAGKPVRVKQPLIEDQDRSSGESHIFHYIKLETYEDALNNLELKRTSTQKSLLDLAESKKVDGFREQYMLRYMLDVESRGSQSLLNVAAFTDPTAYKLKVKRPGSDESREINVDLIETFNWLIGLTVHSIAAPRTFSADFERDSEKRLQLKGRLRQEADGPYWFRTVTGTVPDGRKTLVIWRKLTGEPERDNLVLDEWFTRQGYSSRDSEYDLIHVNGDNNLENLRAADDTWKVRLIEEDFHRLMFDTEDV